MAIRVDVFKFIAFHLSYRMISVLHD